ncbi:glycine betaine/L-proline ABC transporter ATP-binding protein [Listeria cossartiae subsp. cayugensis]|uniref:Quaternary amine transport ATP-binding protein n=1 Tax=Listeria cossartiae subsp. cayugensis TaxID=2713505 RepID=A0ABU2IM45_9LIST|nr:glycine betaine/L-proline ABC transporter ATP-binding protein [Listeria cossartiae]MDT0048761.1 glycine betaine/L-proline ABC transporter ATP-binding protein [Listeria cossartiae subsp. cayugensis]MDT0065264.1 glycine betaine/L-proline ABC transporter ATP-binding protein [Listeria cossartiae subsp. cayugensis]MDT0079132.1 glycine betaine/L-proline ABC transporter ATP-binding protein [Listeria cossartiae subsp. cayugensis]MDT0081968.1 glycine betaine/L-proline ABC transporter ATP-binding prot
MSKIKVEELTKIFGKKASKASSLLSQGKSKTDILKETGATIGVNKASFSVEEGEIFVIMGLSGSGKSTLVRLLNRLIEPTSGKIWLDGKELSSLNKKELLEVRRKSMSMVFQNFGLFPNRTINRNVEYGLEIQGMDKDEREKNAAESLALVGLAGYGDQYPSQLSGGMQQRVGLARALANNPDILLMDEAFSALDPLNRKDMQDQLLDLQDKMKKTIIFITHDLDEALRIGDHIMIMRDGSVVQTGSPEEILAHPANEYVEKFIEDVDRSKVYTASNVMIRPEIVNFEKDGPRVALKRMREAGTSSVFVVKRNRELVGIVHAAEVSKLVKENITSLETALHRDVPTTGPDTPLAEIMDTISTTTIPIAVTEDGKLKGIIIRGSVLAALSGNEVNVNA